MSQWLTRFDGSLIPLAALEKMPHVHRVAWVYLGTVAVMGRMSAYFRQSSGLDRALDAARVFITEQIVDQPLLRSTRTQLFENEKRLQEEGYDIQEFVLCDGLLSSIR